MNLTIKSPKQEVRPYLDNSLMDGCETWEYLLSRATQGPKNVNVIWGLKVTNLGY